MRKVFITILSVIIVTAILITGCGKNGMYKSGQDGYSSITSVDGVTFDVVSSVARNATAITNISEDMNFERNQTYLYKNGESEYFLFNMDSVVCVAEKGTSFGFRNSSDKLAALQSSDVLGVWFTSEKRKGVEYVDSESNGVYKLIATVTGQVSLTSEIYNDFAGKLAVIDDGTTEWALFIGSVGNDFSKIGDNKKAIEYMAASLTQYNAPEIVQSAPAVSLGGETEPEREIETEETSQTLEMEITKDESQGIESASNIETNTEDVIIYVETEDFDKNEISSIESEIDVEMESTENAENAKATIILDNQKNTIKDDDKVYFSDVYDMLPLKKYGYASIYTGSGYENAIVIVDKICTGQEAVKIIKNAFKSGKTVGEYFEASEGCSWHVAHYTVDYSTCSSEGYMNVKLRGMDGEDLKFRGIKYSSRTYVIDNGNGDYYCYYEVPNGCPEYVLECGEGTVEKSGGIVSAYYKIKN